MTAFGALALSGVIFVLGKNFAETEKLLAEKRRIYEEFLRICPRPNEARSATGSDKTSLQSRIEVMYPVLLLYASPAVMLAVSEYLIAFDDAVDTLTPISPQLHESYRRAAKAHNDVVLEMRRDAFSWSFFAHRGKSRIPADALERAKKNAL